jgi:hypothetical protein
MSFLPMDSKNYRPAKLLVKVDILRELDRIVQEGLAGYTNRHELVNDLLEQGVIDLRYGDENAEAERGGPNPTKRADEILHSRSSGGSGRPSTAQTEYPERLGQKPARGDGVFDTPIVSLVNRGLAVENELARISDEPLFGLHNRDAPTAWALARLAEAAKDSPVPLEEFYEAVTDEAWNLADQLKHVEAENGQKLTVMLPRNRSKPQSAAEGFRAFALGHVARKPDEDGRLAAWGPFYQWNAVAVVGDLKDPQIALTEAGWHLLEVFDGLAFSIPHDPNVARRFLAYLQHHARADLWGFCTVLEGAARGAGRIQMMEYFRARLLDDFTVTMWKESVAASIAQGYVSRARAWGLMEPKMLDSAYRATAAGRRALDDFSDAPVASIGDKR